MSKQASSKMRRTARKEGGSVVANRNRIESGGLTQVDRIAIAESWTVLRKFISTEVVAA